MSSDSGRRAWVTRCTGCPRSAWLILTPSRYPARAASPTAEGPVSSPFAVSGARCPGPRAISDITAFRQSRDIPAFQRAAAPLAGLADRGHIEGLDPERGHRRAVEVVAPLARQRLRGRADLEQPRQHAHRRLVEPEVVDRADDLAFLHQVDAV